MYLSGKYVASSAGIYTSFQKYQLDTASVPVDENFRSAAFVSIERAIQFTITLVEGYASVQLRL